MENHTPSLLPHPDANVNTAAAADLLSAAVATAYAAGHFTAKKRRAPAQADAERLFHNVLNQPPAVELPSLTPKEIETWLRAA